MTEEVKQSLIVRSGMALAVVLLLAVMNMLVSYLTTEDSENDTVRVNLAGSLRMESYRIVNRVMLPVNSNEGLMAVVDDLESRLNHPVLKNYIFSTGDAALKSSFSDVNTHWLQLKQKIFSEGASPSVLTDETEKFVVRVDVLIKHLEIQTERKFRLLRLAQGVSLLLAVGIVFFATYQIYFKVIAPLQKLVGMAKKVRGGDFSIRLKSKGDDELSLLTDTFNDMVESLDDMYLNLEDKVQQKTLRLEKVQQRLRLLYDVSRCLSSNDDLVERLRKTAVNIQQHLKIAQVDMYMTYESVDHPFLVSSAGCSPDQLYRHSDEIVESDKTKKVMLAHGGDEYGFLLLNDLEPLQLSDEKNKLLLALVDAIVSAIVNEERHDQQHRLALIEERTVIARELHDSLAQSLSYTKIQISRFKMLQKKMAAPEELDSVLDEISTGIKSSYGQLREILATFRLQLDSPGLQSSLEKTVKEFQQKGNIPITLVYELENFPLSPNEEVHVLQIVREALSNVLRHSSARSADVLLKLNSEGEVQVSICDDGCGFVGEAVGPNHYGKTIMSERASILGSKIIFSDREIGGAEVLLSFESKRTPEQQKVS